MNNNSPLFDAWKLSWGDICSIWALNLDLGNISRIAFIFSTAYLNATACLSSDGWNNPPRKLKNKVIDKKTCKWNEKNNKNWFISSCINNYRLFIYSFFFLGCFI